MIVKDKETGNQSVISLEQFNRYVYLDVQELELVSGDKADNKAFFDALNKAETDDLDDVAVENMLVG